MHVRPTVRYRTHLQVMTWGFLIGGALIVATLNGLHIGLIATNVQPIAAIATAGALAALIAPVTYYIFRGQLRVRNHIRTYFSNELVTKYCDLFRSGATEDERRTLASFSETLENEMFGYRRYIVPSLIFLYVCVLVLYYSISAGIIYAEIQGDIPSDKFLSGMKFSKVSIAAVFGAYTWIAADIIDRYYRNVFHPSCLYWYTMRLVVAIPLGQSIAFFAESSVGNSGPAIAYLVSMFSYRSIVSLASALASRTFNDFSSADESRDLVIKLPGVDHSTADRLANEGITTNCQLASVDPIRLSVRSGLPFGSVLGLVDAAMLWAYVKDETHDKLRACGLKGASGFIRTLERASTSADLDARFCAALAATSQARGALDATSASGADEVENARDAYEKAAAELAAARTAMLEASNAQALFRDASALTALPVSALENIARELAANQYSQFIRRALAL